MSDEAVCRQVQPEPVVEEESPVLDGQTILDAQDLAIVKVDVPEWPCPVYVRVLSGIERDNWEQCVEKAKQNKDGMDNLDVLAGLVIRTVCDEVGNRLFADEQTEALKEKNSTVLIRLAAAAQKLNALSVADIEGMVGNSEGGRSDSSGSS